LYRDWLRLERRRGVIKPSEGFELDQQGVVDPINETMEDFIIRRDFGRAVSKVMATLQRSSGR
jgi:hypothetical protein